MRTQIECMKLVYEALPMFTNYTFHKTWSTAMLILDSKGVNLTEAQLTAAVRELGNIGAFVIDDADMVSKAERFTDWPCEAKPVKPTEYTDKPGVTQRVVDAINTLPLLTYTENELARAIYPLLPHDSADSLRAGIHNAHKMPKYSKQINAGELESKRRTWGPKQPESNT